MYLVSVSSAANNIVISRKLILPTFFTIISLLFDIFYSRGKQDFEIF